MLDWLKCSTTIYCDGNGDGHLGLMYNSISRAVLEVFLLNLGNEKEVWNFSPTELDTVVQNWT